MTSDTSVADNGAGASDGGLTLKPLILASSSPTRQKLLNEAGISYKVRVAQVDEGIIRATVAAEDGGLEPGDLAELLARAKADDVSARAGDAFVLAADQVLACDGTIHTKPETMADARRQLLDLSGKTHQLHSAAVLAKNGEVVWSRVASVDVTFRTLSPEFVGRYLAAAGDAALASVGSYQIEGPGIHLIESLRGDFFAVLGLPLLEVIAALRDNGVVDG